MDYRIIEKTIAYDGFFRMETYRLEHELFAGGWSGEMRRECLERGHAVAVLPYDPERDRLVLLQQFRIGALAAEGGPWLFEFVAGMIGAGETEQEVAAREAEEEAGCRLLDLVPICKYFVSPGGTSETVSLYCARVDCAGLGGIHGLPGEHEDIRVLVLPRTEVLDMLHAGRINSGSPIIALQWLELNRQALLQRWGLRA